jgi:hypothetical protein
MDKLAKGPILKQLLLAKQHSDKRDYVVKHQIMKRLMRDNKQDFYVDSTEGNIYGVTHKPTGFRIHVPRNSMSIRQKVANLEVPKFEPPKLPGGEWYKALIPYITHHEAGRAQALHEMTGDKEDLDITVRHPVLTDFGSIAAGAVPGAVAGYAAGDKLGLPREVGAIIGGAGTAYVASVLAALRRQGKVREQSKKYDSSRVDKKKLRAALEEAAGRSLGWRATKGVITGPSELGRSEQLAQMYREQAGPGRLFKKYNPVGGMEEAAATGASLFLPLIKPAVHAAMGAQSVALPRLVLNKGI